MGDSKTVGEFSAKIRDAGPAIERGGEASLAEIAKTGAAQMRAAITVRLDGSSFYRRWPQEQIVIAGTVAGTTVNLSPSSGAAALTVLNSGRNRPGKTGIPGVGHRQNGKTRGTNVWDDTSGVVADDAVEVFEKNVSASLEEVFR